MHTRVAFSHLKANPVNNFSAQKGQSFIRHYKDINFDTLKERHDNFSFNKAIETKHEVYDTLHF